MVYYHCIVVGAGLAGLRIAHELKKQNKHQSVLVLESREEAGGRVRTEYLDSKTKQHVMYESGPWRIAEEHRRVFGLFKEMKVSLLPLKTPTPKYGSPSVVIPGLSSWDTSALTERNPLLADEIDLSTSYADETHSASGSAPYSVNTEQFFFAPTGFTSVITKLSENLPIDYNCRVADVHRLQNGKYVLTTVVRKGKSKFTQTQSVQCSHLFVCTPPAACSNWHIFREHAKSVMSAVEPGQLHHVYVQDSRFPRRTHSLHPTSLLSQTISSQYDHSHFFQAAYTGGRLARFWHNLKLQNAVDFVLLLKEEVMKATGFRIAKGAVVKSHYWPMGYHIWRTVPNFNLKKSVRLSICPNPIDLPNVYLAGEAFSSHQAWMEGALETADLALASFYDPPPFKQPDKGDTTVEGRVISLSKWANVHPGGKSAIVDHKGEDLAALLSHFGHSTHAWAVVHSLKKG